MTERVIVDPTGDPSPSDNPQNTPPATERPEWLPEKFKTPEAMADAYSSLEKKMSQPKDTPPTDPEPTDDVTIEPDAAKDTVDGLGLDFDGMSNQFTEDGELSQENREALVKAGIPDSMIDGYINGQMSLAKQGQAELKSIAGGDESFTEMADWAKDNLSPGELEIYNKTVNTDFESAKMAVSGLYARYQNATHTPDLINGDSGAGSGSDQYKSRFELTADMKDPRYKRGDPAFQKKVADKLARSTIF